MREGQCGWGGDRTVREGQCGRGGDRTVREGQWGWGIIGHEGGVVWMAGDRTVGE